MSAGTRSRLLLVAAVVFALATAGWQAQLHWSARNPSPAAVVGVGEIVESGGATYRFDSFVAEPRLAPSVEGEEWVEALDGALLVQVVITTEILSADVDPESHFCEVTAIDGAGRQWRPDSTLAFEASGPEAVTCRGPYDDPIQRGEPLQVGFVFQVPADAADSLRFEMSLGYDGETLLLSP